MSRQKSELGSLVHAMTELSIDRAPIRTLEEAHFSRFPRPLPDSSERIREILREIAFRSTAGEGEVEHLKQLADPNLPFGNSEELWKHQAVKLEALVALVAIGQGNDPIVFAWLDQRARNYCSQIRPGMYWLEAVPLLTLIALEHEIAFPTLRLLAETAPLWSIRIACLYGLPESKQNGTYELLESFREWIASSSVHPENWKTFISCVKLAELRNICSKDSYRLCAPSAVCSPLIGWALTNGRADWLMKELRWLQSKGLWDELEPLRDAMAEKAIPDAMQFCLEQVKTCQPDDYVHYSIVHYLLPKHPKPLTHSALEICRHVILHPSHPCRYEHRIEALHYLVEAATERLCPKEEIEHLVLTLAKAEGDPDVLIAAIKLLPWASSQVSSDLLGNALTHESLRIREAAINVLNLKDT